jgi:competence ComEA-like helix-hairpin-helix protein
MATQIDLNHAGPEELAGISGVDSRRAGEIVTYRSKHGPFHNWDEVERVPGVGVSLIEVLRSETTLGDEGALEEDDELETADEEAEEEDIDEDEVAALVAIANLDEEAAMAYELAATTVDDAELREMLRSFAKDHRRHVENLERIIGEVGAEVSERRGGTGGVLLELASTLGGLDTMAAVNCLIANEQLTNGTYQNALQFLTVLMPQEVLEENAADELRHLKALLEYRQKNVADDEEDA